MNTNSLFPKWKPIQIVCILLFFATALSPAFGQCPDGDLELTTQEAVDDFLIEYPDCTQIDGDVRIGDSTLQGDITNLMGLQNITQISGILNMNYFVLSDLSELVNLNSIDGGLFISNSESLTSLDGLQNLTFAGLEVVLENLDNLESASGLENINFTFTHLTLSDCNGLTDLVGLEHLTEMRGITILGNDALVSLDGLQNLTKAGLTVENNNSLTTLTGLDNLTEALWIKIQGNPILTSIAALSSLTSVDNPSYTSMILRDNPMLSSLTGFENLTHITGDLIIENSDALIDMQGLNGLTSADRIIIDKNDALVTLSGFYNLTDVTELYIRENPMLTALYGLDNITVINSIFVEDNESLENLFGLENLVQVNFLLAIKRNNSLIDISSLENLTAIQAIEILNNSSLSACTVLCPILPLANNVFIVDNLSGCNSVDQIDFSCSANAGLGSLFTQTFYDLNEDGIRDANEPLLQIGTYQIDPLNQSVIGNNTIGGFKLLEFGDYQINFATFENWQPTTAESFNVSLDNAQNTDTIFVGVTPTTFDSNVSTSIAYNQQKCNQFVTFDIIATNNGTTIADGTMTFITDDSIAVVEIVDQPDNFNPPNRYHWNFNNLAPGQTVVKQIKLELPGPPETNSGEWLTFNSEVSFTDANGESTKIEEPLNIQIECFPIPNDKLVYPILPNFYSLAENELTYTIRFQNTGNAEIFNVVIEDELDMNLDISTFRLLGSSHEEILSTYLEDRKLTFEFNQIFLPTSTSNYEASQGYIIYSISPVEGIEEFTEVENRADIHFDNNPVVQTNPIQNIIVYSLDHDEDGFMLWEDCDDFNAMINVTAPEIPNNDIDENCDGIIVMIDDDMDGFNSDEDCDDTNADINPGATEIPNNDIDEDCDGIAQQIEDQDGDGFNSDVDCDDSNPDINPDAIEIVNNDIDEDCDGIAQIIDVDMDGFNSDEDCDDNNADINPDATEIANNDIDEDCDGIAQIIDADGDGFNSDEDCDDNNADINPDATEIANNMIDEDCDGEDLVSSVLTINNNEITVFPNPFVDMLYVQQSSKMRLNYQLVNNTGRVLHTGILNQNDQVIELNTLATGIYFLKIIHPESEEEVSQRVVKLK